MVLEKWGTNENYVKIKKDDLCKRSSLDNFLEMADKFILKNE